MENELVGFAADLLDAPPDVVGTVTSGGTESVLLAVQAARDAPPGRRPAADGAADDRARGVPQGRALLRRRARCWCRSVRTTGPTRSRWPRAIDDRTVLVVAQRPVVRARRRGPGHRDRRRRAASARRALPRRRVHRRLGAAVRRTAGPRRAAVDVRGRRASPASRSTCTSTPTRPRAPRCCCTGPPGTARPQFFASAQWPGYTMLNSTLQSTKSRWPARGGLGGREHDRRRGVPDADPRGARGRRPAGRGHLRASRHCGWWPSRTRRWSRSRPTGRATSSRSPTR